MRTRSKAAVYYVACLHCGRVDTVFCTRLRCPLHGSGDQDLLAYLVTALLLVFISPTGHIRLQALQYCSVLGLGSCSGRHGAWLVYTTGPNLPELFL